MKVQLAPLSVLRATPQFVPTKTLFVASGRIEMPNAAGSSTRVAVQSYAAGGVADAGLLHVFPPSVLTSNAGETAGRPSVVQGRGIHAVVVAAVHLDVPRRHRVVPRQVSPREAAVCRPVQPA